MSETTDSSIKWKTTWNFGNIEKTPNDCGGIQVIGHEDDLTSISYFQQERKPSWKNLWYSIYFAPAWSTQYACYCDQNDQGTSHRRQSEITRILVKSNEVDQ